MSTQIQQDLINYALRSDQKKQLEGGFQLEEDPKSINTLRNFKIPSLDCTIVSGFIIDTAPIAHAYKVLLNGNRTAVLCYALKTNGGNPALGSDSSYYAPGTAVLVAIRPGGDMGAILGAIPPIGDAAEFVYYTCTSNASKNEPDQSDLACLTFQTPDNPFVGIYNFSTGLPRDTTDIGEFGFSTATGVKLMLNPFMATMAVDDYSGLWLFDQDSLLRLSGLNLQIRSAGREFEYLNDEGEYIEYEGTAIFPWEQIGYTRFPTSKLIIDTPEEELTGEKAWKSYVEPGKEKAKPFHRLVSFGGWLGQGKFNQIVAPDPEKDWITYEDKEKHLGLNRHTETMDGWNNIISAKEFFIGKRGFIPSVSRVARPDDTSTKIGDNPSNYTKANNFDIESEIPSSDQPLEEVMGLQDKLAYQQNFKEVFPFIQHANDYYVPEDAELNEGLSRFPNFNELTSKQLIKVPAEKEINVVSGGEAERKVKINAAESGLANLSDGSVVQFGGCGEELRMTGGSIFMDAPGDIWFKSGRKIILWAGDDIEIRAKGHIDVSTTEGSIRIKAENQLNMLGGNNGKSGVLIESKGKGKTFDFSKPGEEAEYSGIVLKSSESVVAAMGATVYLRSGVNDSGQGVFIDANEGEHSIYTLSSSVVNYVENAFTINYSNIKTGEVEATTTFDKDSNLFTGSIIASKDGYFVDNVYSGNNLFAVGHIFTGDSEDYDNFVSDYKRGKADLKKQLNRLEDEINTKQPEQYTKQYENKVKESILNEDQIGYEETRKNAGFTFRNQEQYKVSEDFAVYESRWQNIGKNAGKGGNAWEEKGVVSESGEETYPFPGKDYYTGTPCYITQAWTLTDYEKGSYKNRMSGEEIAPEYKEPKYGEQEKKPLNTYPVIK